MSCKHTLSRRKSQQCEMGESSKETSSSNPWTQTLGNRRAVVGQVCLSLPGTGDLGCDFCLQKSQVWMPQPTFKTEKVSSVEPVSSAALVSWNEGDIQCSCREPGHWGLGLCGVLLVIFWSFFGLISFGWTLYFPLLLSSVELLTAPSIRPF